MSNKNRMVNFVPPPPPTAPSIMASDVDSDAEQIASEIMGDPVQSQAPDTEAEQIANELMGVQPAQAAEELPKTAAAKPKKSGQNFVQRKNANTPAKLKMHVPPEPDPLTTYMGGVGRAVTQGIGSYYSPIASIAKQVDSGIGHLRQMPIVGPAFNHMAQMAQAEGAERRANPAASIGATLGVGIPRGILGLGEDIGNIVTRSTGHGAPVNLRGLIDNIPGAQQIQKQFPGSVGGGEMAGVSAIPASLPLKFIGNPVVRHGVQGALGGQALGMIGSAGQQAKTGPINVGQAALEGLPTAALGGALGAAGGGMGAGFRGARRPGGAAEPVAPGGGASEIVMADGSKFSSQEAIRTIQDASTPPEVKSELQELLKAKDEEIVSLGSSRKKKADIKNVRPTVFDDMPANPTPKELNERIAQEVEKASDKDAIDTVENDAIKRITSGIKMKPLQTQALNELTRLTTQRRAELAPEAPKTSSSIPEIPFTEPPAKSPTPPANFLQTRAAKLRDQIPPKGSYEIPDQAGAPEAVPVETPPELQSKVEKTVDALAPDVPNLEKSKLPENIDSMTLEELHQVDDSAFSRPEQQKLADTFLKRLDTELREVEAKEQAAKAQPLEPIGPVYVAEKTATGSRIIDSKTGEIIAENKQGLEQNSSRAEFLNSIAHDATALEKELRKGSRDSLGVKKGKPGIREQIVNAGQPLPAGHPITEKANRVAEAKHNYDRTRAELFSAIDAYDALTNTKSPLKKQTIPIFSEKVEALTKEALEQGRFDDLSIEAQNSIKLEPKERSRFKRGTSEPDAFVRVKELSDKFQVAKNELYEARTDFKQDFYDSHADLSHSVNIPHAKGVVNVRAIPKQGSQLETAASEARGPMPSIETVNRNITDVKRRHKELAAEYDDVATSTEKQPKRKASRREKGMVSINLRKRGKRNQKGSVASGRVEDPSAVSLAKGMEKSQEITDLANSAEHVKNLMTTKHSFDIIKELGKVKLEDEVIDIHNEIIRAVGKEATLARRAKFNPNQDLALIEESLRMTPEEIRAGGRDDMLARFTPDQLNFLATRKAVRADAADLLREVAGNIKEEYGTVSQMPVKVRQQYEVCQQVAESFVPRGSHEGTSEFALLKALRSGMYDYIFKWNPAYHGLNLLDPFVVGTSRVGLANVVRAKAALQDPLIKEYMRDVPSKDTIRQLREEATISNTPAKGVRETAVGKGFRKTREFFDQVPDLPSERWNFEDAFMAGAIMRGDRLLGSGRGAEYVRDVASGKLGLNEEIEMMIEGLGLSDELTGSGSLGINKNPFQRVGWANSFAQFVSQPIRVTRLLRKYINEGNVGAILTFAAANIAFGGRAILPQEVDVLKAIPQMRPLIEHLEDVLDSGKIAAKVPVIGRDLSEKLRYSLLVPFGGGISSPVDLSWVTKFMKDYEGEKWDKVSQSAFLLGLSSVIRGGGTEMNRIRQNIEAMLTGDKKVYAVTKSGKFKGESTYKEVTGKKFGFEEFAKESLLPGLDPAVGEYTKKQLRQ